MGTIIINIICGDIIGSAVVQGGRGNAIDYNAPGITPAVVEALRAALVGVGDSPDPDDGDATEDLPAV